MSQRMGRGLAPHSYMDSLKLAVRWLLWAFLLLPPTGIVTIALAPVWDRFESATGIESLGHSGPAGWCYAAVYGVLLALTVFVRARQRAREARNAARGVV